MKHLIFIGLVVIIAACGKTEEPRRPTTPTNPPASNNPAPPNPMPANSKWTQAEFDTQTQNCANKGGSSYTRDQWRRFCSCVYAVAAPRYTLAEFTRGFNSIFEELSYDGTISGCQSSSGM